MPRPDSEMIKSGIINKEQIKGFMKESFQQSSGERDPVCINVSPLNAG